jgi:hypothetical protein
MPIESILFLSLVIGALFFFGGVVAYADWAWRQPPANSRNTAMQPPSRETDAAPLKKAA